MNQPRAPKFVIEISSLHGLQFKIPIGGEEDLALAEKVIAYATTQIRKELDEGGKPDTSGVYDDHQSQSRK